MLLRLIKHNKFNNSHVTEFNSESCYYIGGFQNIFLNIMESEEKMTNVVCHYCHNIINVKSDNLLSDDKTIKTVNKCREWLDNCKLRDDSSVYEESLSSETATLQEDDLGEDNVVAVALKNKNVHLHDEMIVANNHTEIIELDNLINKECSRFENIQINKSRNVHIGDVMHINGPVYVNQLKPTINQNIVINQTHQQTPKFSIVSRIQWLAQPPLDPDDVKPLKKPVKYVIIFHSASEEAYTQAGNNLLVRIIQQMHVESKHWNDIAYNFLIGAEGSIYEGRGWDLVGSHSFRYNRISIGICFIGCYINKLPPEAVIKKAKEFIEYGVEIGAIDEDYRILAHCQCSSTESPGRRFFEEIKTWERWDGSISVENPSPLLTQA